MKKIGVEEVRHTAKLSNLTIKEEEEEKFSENLSSVLEAIKNLNEIDTSHIAPTSHVTGLSNVTKDDVMRLSLTSEEALSQSENIHNGYFKVKGILNKT